MGKVAIGYGNLVDTSTLSASACTSGHPITETQTRELARYAEFSSASPEIIIDLGAAKTWQVVAAFAHSIEGASDTATVSGGTTSGGSEAYAGSALSCCPFTPINAAYDGSHFGVFIVLPAPVTCRYVKLALSTSAAPRIGRIFAGPLFVPGYNPVYGDYVDDWQPANSTIDRTENGADWAATRTELRATSFSYQAMSHGRASLMHEIVRTHSVTGEVVFVPSTDDRERQQQYGFLGTMRKLSALEYPFYDHRATAIGIDERGGAP